MTGIFIQEDSVQNQALWEALKKGDITALKDALTKGANPNFINRNDEGDPTPLHETVQTNASSSFVQELLAYGACTNVSRLDTKNTPLHEAAASGNEEICRLLLDSNAKEIPNAYGNTPCFSAVRAGNVDIVHLLLENDHDINAKNHLGSSMLHLCSFLAFTSETSEDDMDSNKNKNKTLILQPHLQIAAILLSNNEFVLIDEKDENGYTPLHIAAQRGHDEMVKLLVDSGSDISIRTTVDLKGRGGRTAREMAKFAGKERTSKLLESIELNKDSYISGKFALDLQSGYSIRNPIVGGGALGVRRKSNCLDCK